ncbi:tetracycline-efflux transporter [Aspergillus ellipticus CBS 707.79]|uniref:Tetracycline-efflux transporter n=1 Tax=Aspergillus ellipticus CBS 707.79 TaxID=1448320 RepID=A0A319CVC7_9EURO|nr:tetracycline-efflux transporter [Aspergillus ellipticus CBS 707.79]
MAGPRQAGASETSPLLSPSRDGDGESPDAGTSAGSMGQVILLCCARAIDPLAFFTIFPFANQMIAETTGMKESNVGFYSGIIESLFSVTQMLLMIPWARAADRIGRKPTLVLSLAGLSVSSALFGFSQTLGQMIFLRCLAGVFGGTVVTVRVMISENSTPDTQARAFSYFSLANTIGTVVGPLLGGALSRPGVIPQFPYALPTVAAGGIGAVVTVACMFLGNETRAPGESGHKAATASPWTTAEILRSPGVRPVLYIYGHSMLLAFAYTAVSPVFYFTSPKLGGYGFSPFFISLFLGGSGIAQTTWLLLVYPSLHKRLGSGRVLRGMCAVWIVFLAGTVGASLLRHYGETVAFWILAPLALMLGSSVAMQLTAIQLALDAVSPSPAALGTLNAMALAIISCLRAVAPALFTSLYASSLKLAIGGVYVFWAVLGALVVILMIALRWLPEQVERPPQKPDQTRA